MKKLLLKLFSLMLVCSQLSFAQSNNTSILPQLQMKPSKGSPLEKLSMKRNCGTMESLAFQLKQDPTLMDRMQLADELAQKQALQLESSASGKLSTLYKIAVVVHVLYTNQLQNISDAQILSQIAALNRDFRKQNQDISQVPSVFSGLAADVEIEFCLANQDPNGAATTGITRTQTSVTSFDSNSNNIKSDAAGGKSPWNTTKYLNLWVGELQSGLLGYAQFPGGSQATDGVVINYAAFGTMGTANAPFNLGRTATHEVGHYLGLRHIWGDAICGDDFINDTPTQNDKNFQCPSFPHVSANCNNNAPNGDMFMNYMDYVDDACMFMFTVGQKNKMVSSLTVNRSNLLTNTNINCTASTPSLVCDTLIHLSTNSTPAVYQPTDVPGTTTGTGYVCGTNSFNDVAKAEKFAPLTSAQKIYGVYVAFAVTNNSSNTFQVKVWRASTVNGEPSTVMATKSLTYSSIQADVSNQSYTYISFSQPVIIPSGSSYFVGIEFDPAMGDIAIYSNSFGQTNPGTAWEKWDDGTWHTFADPNAWNINVSLYIASVACVDYTGVDEKESDLDEVQIFPNPSHSIFSVKSQLLVNQKFSIKVFNLMGAQVFAQTDAAANRNQVDFDLVDQPDGLYLVELKTNEQTIIKKVNLIH